MSCFIAFVRSGTESCLPLRKCAWYVLSSSHVSLRRSENGTVIGSSVAVCGEVVIDVTFLGKAGGTINGIPGSLATQPCSSNLCLADQGWLVRTRAVQWLMGWHACLPSHHLDHRLDQVNGQRDDNGRILLHGDLRQPLQVA